MVDSTNDDSESLEATMVSKMMVATMVTATMKALSEWWIILYLHQISFHLYQISMFISFQGLYLTYIVPLHYSWY